MQCLSFLISSRLIIFFVPFVIGHGYCVPAYVKWLEKWKLLDADLVRFLPVSNFINQMFYEVLVSGLKMFFHACISPCQTAYCYSTPAFPLDGYNFL